MEPYLGKNNHTLLHKTSKFVLYLSFGLILLALSYPIFLFKYSSKSSSFSYGHIHKPIIDDNQSITSVISDNEERQEFCDIFSGEWVPNPQAPYYTNKTCWAIHENQNCQKYGRPDSDYMKWRWKPNDCDMPVFNPAQFLEIVRGKSLAFVGDSVARNQMQSLICLLSRDSQIVYPIDASPTKDEHFKRWRYETYNFTLSTYWTPHLVRSEESDDNGPTHTGLFNLYLDEFNQDWATQIEHFDYVIISGGHWFMRPMVFYEKGKIAGCHYCQLDGIKDLTMYYGYRKAFRTAFKAISSLKNYKGVTFLRTFAPSHFENGQWNEGGNCLRTKPFKSNETTLEGFNMEFYMIQLEEFKTAEKEAKKNGLKFRLMDTTPATLLRPDGHPSRYNHWPHEKVTLYNDCVHWCLPGPIDTWNDFLLQMLKMEGIRSAQEKLHSSDRKMRIR
ncbi:hypothetical protein ACFE04_005211 [Oxalis oulophora]